MSEKISFMKEKPLQTKSFNFAVRIINLYRYLSKQKKEYILSKQILRSGTSIGALIREAEYGESKLDFIHKLKISLKEANETLYWIELLEETKYLSLDETKDLKFECTEIIKLLTSSIVTTSKNISK